MLSGLAKSPYCSATVTILKWELRNGAGIIWVPKTVDLQVAQGSLFQNYCVYTIKQYLNWL